MVKNGKGNDCFKNKRCKPWLVWLSGLGPHPPHVPHKMEGRSWILGQDPRLGWGQAPPPPLGVWEKQPTDVFLAHRCCSPSFSLPSPFSKNKIFKKIKTKGATREYGTCCFFKLFVLNPPTHDSFYLPVCLSICHLSTCLPFMTSVLNTSHMCMVKMRKSDATKWFIINISPPPLSPQAPNSSLQSQKWLTHFLLLGLMYFGTCTAASSFEWLHSITLIVYTRMYLVPFLMGIYLGCYPLVSYYSFTTEPWSQELGMD